MGGLDAVLVGRESGPVGSRNLGEAVGLSDVDSHSCNTETAMIVTCQTLEVARKGRLRGWGAWLAVIGLMLGLCACGGSSTGQNAQIRVAISRWAGARSAAQECAMLSSGARFFIGRGDYFSCARYIARKPLGPVAPKLASVVGIRFQAGQAVVRARLRPADRPRSSGGVVTVFLVRQGGAWRVNSTGVREGLGPPPPGAPGTPAVKQK
jgi:hypothetical protein